MAILRHAFRFGALTASAVLVALALQGCGSDSGTSSSTTPAPPSPSPSPAPHPGPAPAPGPMGPIRGIYYETVMPELAEASVVDMAQAKLQGQWGSAGRGDLEMIKSVGANMVRVGHALGSEYTTDHKAFLDEAHALGLGVIVGFHSQGYCPDFNCYSSWKKAAEEGFKIGFAVNGSWHPAVRMIVLSDKPDYLNFIGKEDGSRPDCDKSDSYCGTKAALSALDGFLAAEQGAKISGSPKLAVAWSMNVKASLDGTVSGEGVSSFQDMESSIADPKIVGYAKDLQTNHSILKEAFESRWVHGLDTQSPWKYLTVKIVAPYEQTFKKRPWFVANFDYAVPQGTKLAADLATMDSVAADESNPFMGSVFSSFQRDYKLGTSVLGMFGLGNETIGHADPCWNDVLNGKQACSAFLIKCLDEAEGDPGRVDAIRSAWKGTKRSQGVCNKTTARTQEIVV